MYRKFANFIAAVAAGTAAAVGTAFISLVVMSFLDKLLRGLSNDMIFLVGGAFLVLSIVVGVSTCRYVWYLLTMRA